MTDHQIKNMNQNSILPTRLKAAAPGLGQASQTEIELRAVELAVSDGRHTFTDADLNRAAAELAGGGATEADPALGEMTSWDDPPEQSGHRVASTPSDDASNIAERLIQNGLDEADHDIRVAAADEKSF